MEFQNSECLGEEINSIDVEYGAKVIKPTDPIATGYTFNGWFKDEECLNSWYFETDIITIDITLCAKWSIVEVDKIDVKTNPIKLEYTVGEQLDLIGAKLTVSLANCTATEIDITSSMISGFDPNKSGEQTVSITYEGKTTTFKINVKTANNEPIPENEKDRLSIGALIGITCCIVIVLAVVLYIVMFFVWKKKQKGFKILFSSFEKIDKLFYKK